MDRSLPSKFVKRIEGYPGAVRVALQAPTDEAWVTEATEVLYGALLSDPDEIARMLAHSPIVDALLSRLMRSNRFRDRMFKVLKKLADETTTSTGSVIDRTLTALGDPEQPYYYKLRELADAEVDSPETHPVLKSLLCVVEFSKTLRENSETPMVFVMQALVKGDMPLLPGYLASQSISGLERLAPPMPLPLSQADGMVIAAAILKTMQVAPLPSASSKSLRRCAAHLATVPEPVLPSVPGPLRVTYPDGLAQQVQDWWEAQHQAGLVEVVPEDAQNIASGHLVLRTDLQPDPTFLAYLGRLPGGLPTLQVTAAGREGSWARDILGYGVFGVPEECGTFHPANARTGAVADPLEMIPLASLPGNEGAALRSVSFETCYAILVRTDPSVDVSVYANADHCLVVDGLDALATTFAEVPDTAVLKPVVLLGRRTPVAPNHVVEAVQRHWRYGGLYVTAPALAAMDMQNGRILLGLPDGEEMGHATLAALAAMPLSMAITLAADPVVRAQVAQGLLILPDNLILKHPGQARLTRDMLSGLERWINNLDIDPVDLDALFLAGEVDFMALDGRSLVRDWPIAEAINDASLRIRSRRSRLAQLARSLNAAQAESLLVDIEADTEMAPLAEDFEAFAVALSERPDIMLQMGARQIAYFLELCRQSRAMDQVAENLSVASVDICHSDISLVIPLFELLASSLPNDTLQVTLSLAATHDLGRNRIQYRFAECMRRYGSVDLMLHYLHILKAANPELTGEEGFRRLFQRILLSLPDRRLRITLGADLVGGIRDAMQFKDVFMQAVVNGDLPVMRALLGDTDRFRNLEVVKWLDTLRGHSNELRAAGLSIDDMAVPGLGNIYIRKLLAATFSDAVALADLHSCGMIDDPSDLSITCRNILGDNGPLNTMLAGCCADADLPPIQVEGGSIHEVFAMAARHTDQVARAGSRTTEPLVTVIVSAFEADVPLLKLSLDSVLNQTHAAVEVFVIDDASSAANEAGIVALVDSYDDRVQYIRMEENSGPYAGRNRAIAASKGDFIAIQDADDWSHPDRFAEQLAAFAATPSLQLVTTPHIRIDRAGNIQMEAQFSILGDGPMTSMFRRSVFETLGRFAPVRSRGDVEMRERIRAYFGPHTYLELSVPMMLCFADSATLSQKTKGEKMEFLQLFRTNVSKRRNLRLLHLRNTPLSSDQAVQIPLALRAPEQATLEATQ